MYNAVYFVCLSQLEAEKIGLGKLTPHLAQEHATSLREHSTVYVT